MAYVKRNNPMDWTEAIARVLAEKGGPMSVKDITEKIIRKGYYSTASSATPQKSVNSYLSENKKGLFEKVKRGIYKLKGTPAPHATVGRGAPIVASSCPSYPLGKSVTAKVDLDVLLRKLVLACIEIIGRKCFDAQELYAFAPIFKVCVPECQDLEKALKQQLDKLVIEGLLDILPHDCYSKK